MILEATALRAASYTLIGSESTPPCLNAMCRGTDGAYTDQWRAGANKNATRTEAKEAETTVGALAESSSGERAVGRKHLWQERAERKREQAEQELLSDDKSSNHSRPSGSELDSQIPADGQSRAPANFIFDATSQRNRKVWKCGKFLEK